MATSHCLRALAARHHARRLPFELPGIGAEWQRWMTATQLATRSLRRHAIAVTHENPLCVSNEDLCLGVAVWGVGLLRKLQGAITRFTKRDMRTFFAGAAADASYAQFVSRDCGCCGDVVAQVLLDTGRLPSSALPFHFCIPCHGCTEFSVFFVSASFPSHNLPRSPPLPPNT